MSIVQQKICPFLSKKLSISSFISDDQDLLVFSSYFPVFFFLMFQRKRRFVLVYLSYNVKDEDDSSRRLQAIWLYFL